MAPGMETLCLTDSGMHVCPEHCLTYRRQSLCSAVDVYSCCSLGYQVCTMALERKWKSLRSMLHAAMHALKHGACSACKHVDCHEALHLIGKAAAAPVDTLIQTGPQQLCREPTQITCV